MKDEEWGDLPGYGGDFSVSTHGRVRSNARVLSDGRYWASRILKAAVGRSTYLEVALPSEKKYRRRLQVHRLVCTVFNGPPTSEKPMALHRDGNKFNNVADNLYWGDYDDNMRDRIRHGRHFNSRESCKRGHSLSEDNVYTPPNLPGSRYCRTCRRMRHQKWYEGVKNERNGSVPDI